MHVDGDENKFKIIKSNFASNTEIVGKLGHPADLEVGPPAITQAQQLSRLSIE